LRIFCDDSLAIVPNKLNKIPNLDAIDDASLQAWIRGLHYQHFKDIKVLYLNCRKVKCVKSALKLSQFLNEDVINCDIIMLSETNINSQAVIDIFVKNFKVAASTLSSKGGVLILGRRFNSETKNSVNFKIKQTTRNSALVLLRQHQRQIAYGCFYVPAGKESNASTLEVLR